MLDFNKIQQQLGRFSLYQAELLARRRTQLEAFLALWAEIKANGQAATMIKNTKAEKKSKTLVATPLEIVTKTVRASPRPEVVTVVATDGSQIYPDHHIEPTCYLLNFSQIGFQYGTTEKPCMNAVQDLRYREQDFEAFDHTLSSINAAFVSAIRDIRELEVLLETAQVNWVADRPLVALADGTLIRWTIQGMKNKALETLLIDRYSQALEGFMECSMPICSYLSQPDATDVRHLFETYHTASLDLLTDRMLFNEVLGVGERSAIFKSQSEVLEKYSEAQQVAYFYVKVKGRRNITEVARVEFPLWVAAQPTWVDLILSVVLDQAEKGDGYPIILSEAHEKATIRQHEEALFFQLLDRQLRNSGMGSIITSRKQASKKRPVV